MSSSAIENAWSTYAIFLCNTGDQELEKEEGVEASICRERVSDLGKTAAEETTVVDF